MKPILILAHGAGAPKTSLFMLALKQEISQLDIEVISFNFPFMDIIQQTGKRRPPDRAPKLLAAFADQIKAIKEIQSRNI